jgi:HD-like signal output (HDOD) protein/CheY-like chemotaxis protein
VPTLPIAEPKPSKKRILFVDDEPLMSDLFRLMFEGMKSDWDLYFAHSGPEALALLEKTPCEVVVSDMRMPGMNGAQLLNEVMRRHPKTARIILSGYAERETVAKCVGAVHQFLQKPSDVLSLKSTLAHVCALDMLLRDEKLKALVAQMGVLPSLPSLYFRVMEELQSPDASAERIGEIVGMDPAMTAKLLQLVNSAFFGISRRIANPTEAVQFLGVGTVRSLALTIHAFACFDQAKLAEFSFERIWNHSVTAGVFAKRMSQIEGLETETSDEALIAGLLHDVGKLMLISNQPDEYRVVIKLAGEKRLRICEAELMTFGATHAEIGAYLLGLWGLPVPVVEAVALHHHPARGPSGQFSPLTAVHVADFLEHERSGGTHGEAQALLDTEYLARLGLTDRLERWRKVFEDQISQAPELE